MFHYLLFLLVYVFTTVLFGNAALREVTSFMGEELPVVMGFSNLHLAGNFTSAIKSLKGLVGIYCIRCGVTGAMYIGSTTNLGRRIGAHFIESTNIHLRNAINLYGISAFVYIVVEFVEIQAGSSSSSIKALLLSREQFYLNLLFSLPASFRFNFLPHADTLLGFKPSSETKAQISASMLGNSNGITKAVLITDVQGKYIAEFSTRKAAGH
jgi:group I intron endonuclease